MGILGTIKKLLTEGAMLSATTKNPKELLQKARELAETEAKKGKKKGSRKDGKLFD